MFPIQITVPTRYPPVVTWSLIGANVLVFHFELSLSPLELDLLLSRLALVPARELSPGAEPGLLHFLPFVSTMFLHGGWLHLILNMWTLWLFGPVVEDRLGSGRFLLFYGACGLAASLTHALSDPDSTIPALGASGAIAGVIASAISMFPRARMVVVIPVLFFPFFFEVPAILFAGLWFLTQVLRGTAEVFVPTGAGGVAWWAHIGGFLAGLVLTPALCRPRQRYRPHFADEGILGFGPTGR